jgi:hypothetical protein
MCVRGRIWTSARPPSNLVAQASSARFWCPMAIGPSPGNQRAVSTLHSDGHIPGRRKGWIVGAGNPRESGRLAGKVLIKSED